MSNKAERRRRKAEKQAANKQKRQQRHADERLRKQEGLAAVKDERDILDTVNTDEQNEPVAEPEAVDTESQDIVSQDAVVLDGDVEPDDDDAADDSLGENEVFADEDESEDDVLSPGEVFVDEDEESVEAFESDVQEPDVEPDVELDESEPLGQDEVFADEDEYQPEPDAQETESGAEIAAEPPSDDVEPQENVSVVTTGGGQYDDFEDPFADDDEIVSNPFELTRKMSDEELDAELGDFEPSEEPEVQQADDKPDDEVDPIEVYDDSHETEALTDEEIMEEETAGRVMLTAFDDNDDPFADDPAGMITRSEDIGSAFREYDSSQEFEEKDYSDDFSEDVHDGDLELVDENERPEDFSFVSESDQKDVRDLEYVSESEAVGNDAEIIEHVVEKPEDEAEPQAEESPKERKQRERQEQKERKRLEKLEKKAKKAKGESDEQVNEEPDEHVGEVPVESDQAEDEKPAVVKLTRKDKKEQRKHDLEVLKADKLAYKEFKKSGGKGPLVRDGVKLEVEPPVEVVADKPEVKKPEPAMPKKKGNKRNGMASVMRESVVEAVWPDFLENEKFLVERNGEQKGVGLFFDTATIGGFNRKSKNDESKGGVLEAISSGLLKHLITSELMDSECIIFIPCVESMSVIEEYMILYNAEYTLCYVNSDGEFELTNLPISASDVEMILREHGDVSDWIREHTPESELEEQALEEVLEQEDEADEEPVQEYVPTRSDEDFIEDNEDYGMESSPYDDMETYQDEGDEPYDEIGYDDTADLESYDDVGEYEQESEANEYDIISFDTVNDTIVRTFYSDDLRLEVSTEPFDSLFIHQNRYVPFQANRIEQFDKDDTFIGQAVTEMVKDYNTQLEGMHVSNIRKLRSDYYTLVNLACTRIAEKYDLDNPETEVGYSKKALDADYQLKLSTQEERSHQETNRINMEWQETLKKVGEAAAEKARASYTDRFLRAHNDDLAHVMPNIKLADETDYKTRLQELHDTRRESANDDLDKFVNEIVAKLNEKYKEMMDEEEAARNAWADELRAYVDEHRKDEFARAAALAERQRQRSEADMVRSEMIGTVNKMRSEFETSQAKWNTQMQRMQSKHDEELRAKDQLRENKIAEMADEQARLNGVIDDLNHQIETLDEVKEHEYKSRVAQLENESLSWKAEMEHQRVIHKRRNIISATLAIIAILAALSVGFIGGAYVNLKADRTNTAQAIVDKIDERLEENDLIESSSVVEPIDEATSSTAESSTIDEDASSAGSDTDAVSDASQAEDDASGAEGSDVVE